MKKIIVIIVVLSFISLKGFNQLAIAGQQVPNPSLNRYVGTWYGVNGNKTIKLVLKKEFVNILGAPMNYFTDVIIGYHEYKVDGIVVESSLSWSPFSTFISKKYTILGSNADLQNQFKGTIKDITNDKLGNINMQLNDNQNQLTWNVSNTHGIKLDNNFVPEFTFPTTGFILFKE